MGLTRKCDISDTDTYLSSHGEAGAPKIICTLAIQEVGQHFSFALYWNKSTAI